MNSLIQTAIQSLTGAEIRSGTYTLETYITKQIYSSNGGTFAYSIFEYTLALLVYLHVSISDCYL
jgi:hypothetical protein